MDHKPPRKRARTFSTTFVPSVSLVPWSPTQVPSILPVPPPHSPVLTSPHPSSTVPPIPDFPFSDLDENIFDYYKNRSDHTEKLAKEQTEKAQKLDFIEDNSDLSNLCWENVKVDDNRCRIICGFTCLEFMEILVNCQNFIPMNIARGRRSKCTVEDKLLIVLCYLKHYESQDKLGVTFGISKSQINRIISSTLRAITPILYRTYVTNVHQIINNPEFPNARFVMDTTIQKIWRPIGSFQEKKRFYSGKHRIYGLKSLTLHNLNGLLVDCWPGSAGSIHDLTILMGVLIHVKRLVTRYVVNSVYWEIFADKGFVGIESHLKVIIPHKKPKGKKLTIIQTEYNKKVSGIRVICERWYGRMKTLYRIIAGDYHNNHEDYPVYFKMCAALTNYNIIKHPLEKEEPKK